MVKVALWLATAAVSGAIAMALELVGIRLYAPYFGYSIYVWGSLISVIMAVLAVGYAAGGWIADRTQTALPLYIAMAASGVYQLGVLFIVYAILPGLAELGDFIGTSLATLVLFAPPMTALAAVSPIVVRLVARAGHVGAAAGVVSALATIGGVAGIVAAAFWLLPVLGTQATLRLLCALSLAIGSVGLATTKCAALAGTALLAAVPLAPGIKWPPDTVWVTDSPYNLVRVARRGDRLILFLNDDAAQTVREVSGGATGFYYDQFALGPLLVHARHALVLGMGAGGSIQATKSVAPDVEFNAVEIDPAVIEAAVRWFGVNIADPRLHIHVADARRWLAQSPRRFDLVHLDVYQGGPYIPFYLITEEFFRLLRAHMTDDALLMMNLFAVSQDSELLSATAATLKQVFPTVLEITNWRGNHMVFAFTSPRSLESVRKRLADAPRTERVARSAISSIGELTAPAGVRGFTDDLAPVEAMTRRMLRDP